jgi:hypothetical protein
MDVLFIFHTLYFVPFFRFRYLRPSACRTRYYFCTLACMSGLIALARARHEACVNDWEPPKYQQTNDFFWRRRDLPLPYLTPSTRLACYPAPLSIYNPPHTSLFSITSTPSTMSDDESHQQTFEQAGSGASLTYPMQCSALRKKCVPF